MAAPTQEFPPWLTPSVSLVTDAAGAVATTTDVVYVPPTYLGPSIPLGTLYIFGGTTEPPTIELPGSTQATVLTTSSATPITTSITTSTSATPITSSFSTTTSNLSTSSISSTTSATVTTTALTSSTSASTSASASTSPSSITVLTSVSSTSSASASSSVSSTLSSVLSSSTTATTGASSSMFSTTSPTPTPTVGALGMHSRLSKGQLIGIIIASILGVIFLFVLALFLYLFCKGRSRRASRDRFSMLRPIDEDYFVVGAGGRSPGEGSPRHSGEEADPFLQRSGGNGNEMTEVGEMGARPRGVTRVPPPAPGTQSSSGSSSTNTSGYGVLLDRPSLGLLPSTAEEPESHRTGQILTDSEMERIDQESVLPPPENSENAPGAYAYTTDEPLLPPPRLVDPAPAVTPKRSFTRPVVKTHDSYTSELSSFPADGDEAATLLTARRVKVDEMVTPSTLHSPGESSSSPSSGVTGSFLGGLGLGGLANIGRFSWFKSMDSPRHSRYSPDFTPVPLSDSDLEHGRHMSSNVAPDSQGSRNLSVGVGPDGSRPISSVSQRSVASAGTVYHDAFSSLPSTPNLTTLPRALTPSAPPVAPVDTSAAQNQPTGHSPPPAYVDFLDRARLDSPTASTFGQSVPAGFDVLDMPAPSAISPFTGSSTSLREVPSSVVLKKHPYPPGLELLTAPKSWGDLSSGATPSPGSYTAMSDNTTIDNVLDEAPPAAGENWRSMASTTGLGLSGGRTSFGIPTYIYQPDFVSEQGSLHSMRSHIGPSRSTGSAAASRYDMTGSNSSRPSARSGSSGLSVIHSLSHSGSISSDGRRRNTNAPASPALSAFGPQVRSREPPLSPAIGSLPSAHLGPDRNSDIRPVVNDSMKVGVGSEVGAAQSSDREPVSPLSPSLRLSSAPWVGGLDNDWSPA